MDKVTVCVKKASKLLSILAALVAEHLTGAAG